jgi:hypothetical protein
MLAYMVRMITLWDRGENGAGSAVVQAGCAYRSNDWYDVPIFWCAAADPHRRHAAPRSGSGAAALPAVTTLRPATLAWTAAR